VDILATAGWLVPEIERSAWELVIGSADDVLERSLKGERERERVGLFIEDTARRRDPLNASPAERINCS
jgi:hypothetical protein